MIDSHCHLNFDSIKSNFTEVIKNAQTNNISSILSINTDPNDFKSHYELIEKYQSIYISYGLHPEHVSIEKTISKETILKNIILKKVIAIGETGLDFYHSTKYKDLQYKVFEEHIEAAIKSNLPLIIHQRNSEKEIIEVLKSYLKYDNINIVFHCFTGSKLLKNFCLDNNFYISISGIITFKNANSLREVIRDVPLNNVLLETDSPFLSPSPLRGKQNQPSHIIHIFDYLADFFQISLTELINITDDNFYKLFSKAIRYNAISL